MNMRIEVLSVFPEVFNDYMSASIMGRAQKMGAFEFITHNLRTYTHDAHHSVDDTPFGGGQGMLMKPAPIYEAYEDIQSQDTTHAHTVFFTPCGDPFSQKTAQRLAKKERILFVCGRYEGMDERVYDLADETISLGDYVLTGGELCAMVVSDAIVRLLPGVLGNEASCVDESFSNDGLLEYAQYTRPANYCGKEVPDVLLSGNHKKIAQWRRRSALQKTYEKRPDLLASAHLSDEERVWLDQLDK